MNQWLFVIAAYGVALGGTAGLLLWASITLRRADAALDELSQ